MEQRRLTKKEIVDAFIAEGASGRAGEIPSITIQNLRRLLTKKEMIDQLVTQAAFGQFKGDKRDGETPPITIQNFSLEMPRYAAKALRARLSRLSFAELFTEAIAAADYKDQLSRTVELAERLNREEVRQRQAELGRRSRLQTAILAAARHYRDQGINAGEAWDAIRETPFNTDDGSTVEIEGGKLRTEQKMRVMAPDGRQLKRSIKWDQWRQTYWKAATKPG
jgi:hypothetical protein